MSEENTQNTSWLLCPICQNKTRLKLRADTVLDNFLLFCPKCKKETLVNVREFKTEIIEQKD
ncbi:MAG: cysteine-rich KTR domain-containing protein [Anaerostipes sp.]|nr:cysteine-rich KTR domain-containing protein [Anaerostipes sp.]